MREIIKKHKFLFVVLIIDLAVLIVFPYKGRESIVFTGKNLINFLYILPPIFICIGLLDIWVERETMIKIMGEKSGIRGVLVSFMFGVLTAVPLYALLPVAGMLLKKGSKISNVLIFICSCTSIRIPLLLFEGSSMGWKFTATRFVVNIFVVLITAYLIDTILTDKNKDMIYENANKL